MTAVAIKVGLADHVEKYLNTGEGPAAKWLRGQALKNNGTLAIGAPEATLLCAECDTGSAYGEAMSASFEAWLENLGPVAQDRLRPLVKEIKRAHAETIRLLTSTRS